MTTRDSQVNIIKEEKLANNRNKIAPQLLAGFLANLAFLEAGIAFGWSTPSLPKLLDKDSDLPLTSDEGAWVVSSLSIGACFGPIISALFVNRIGRKSFLYFTAIPCLICWILIYFAESFATLFIARFICGISVGAIYSTAPIYLGEIAETRIRGALGTMSCTNTFMGLLLMYAIGPWVNRKILALINIIPSIFLLLTFVWMPETPYYYLYKGHVEPAKKSLIWLRGNSLVDEELEEMLTFVTSEKNNNGKIQELITNAGNRRATLIIFIMLGAQQFSGLVAITSYLNLFFNEASLNISSEIAVIITGVVSVLSNIVANFIVDRVGRKSLILSSSIGSFLCLLIIGTYFCLKDFNTNVNQISWILVFAMIFFQIFFAFGIGPIPYTVLSEIYPTAVKGWATMVASIYGSILGFLTIKIYQVVLDAWGLTTIFYGFASLEFIFAILIVIFIPETKGKSFMEIQENLQTRDKTEESTKC